MESKFDLKSNILSIAILLGLFLLGFCIYKGLKTFSDKDRVVTVKGLAEMDMTATSADINLDYSFSGDDLNLVISNSEEKKNSIISYLKNNGFKENDISIKNMSVVDNEKYFEITWINGQQVTQKIDRYIIKQSISVKVKNISGTEDIAAKIQLDLVSNNLTSTIATEYTFPELNTIKPALIAASTKNARIAGEQFAKDSEAKLGKIKTASQGQITLAGEYFEGEEFSQKPKYPYIQKARVVSTIVFFLE